MDFNGLTMDSLYSKIKEATYTTSGLSVDWTIQVDNDKHLIILMFEETNGSMDWKTNFNFPASLYKQQKNSFLVHKGYGKAYKSCNNDIMQTLVSLYNTNPDYFVIVSGWSYGGAMAVLAGEDFFFRTGICPTLITFGAPKVLFGNKTKHYFWKCFSGMFQFAHVNDCVPLLPPFPGFKQVNKCKVGTGFRPWRLFHPTTYHCIYGDSGLYL